MILYFGCRLSAVASWNGKFHLSPHENIFTIALINIHYLYIMLYTVHMSIEASLSREYLT